MLVIELGLLHVAVLVENMKPQQNKLHVQEIVLLDVMFALIHLHVPLVLVDHTGVVVIVIVIPDIMIVGLQPVLLVIFLVLNVQEVHLIVQVVKIVVQVIIFFKTN